MPFNANRKLFAELEYQVRGVDFHPVEPWLFTGLNTGAVNIHDILSGSIIHTFQTECIYLFCLKLINGKNWFVAGSSSGKLCVYNYHTDNKVITFDAHTDEIRCIAVHPTFTIILTGGGDGTIKAWDWDKEWRNIQTFNSHRAHVMSLAFKPKSSKTFVSSSFDGTVNKWSIDSQTLTYCITRSDRNYHYAEFYPGTDKPYLVIATSDDTLEVWNYRLKKRVQTMYTTTANFVIFHPNLPIVISGGKNGIVNIWNRGTWKIELTINYSLGEARCVAFRKETNEVAVGFEMGVVTFEIHQPIFSMGHSGELIYTRNRKVLSGNLRNLDATKPTSSSGGVQIPLQVGKLDSIKIIASSLIHSPNGRFVTIVGDGKYIIYTALEWRKESSGDGISFAWAPDSNTYAVLKSEKKLNLYKKDKGSKFTGNPVIGALFASLVLNARCFTFENVEGFVMEGLYTGPVLGARGPGYVIFLDWETGDVIRRIDIDVENIYWSTSGTYVAITSYTSHIYYFDRDAFQEHGPPLGNDGVPECFTHLSTITDTIHSAKWIGDCLMYTMSTQLCYLICHTNQPNPQEFKPYPISPLNNDKVYLLGYIPEHEKVYVVDEDMKVYGFGFSFSVVEFQTAVLRGDRGSARELLKNVPQEFLKNLEGPQFINIMKSFESRVKDPA